MPIANNILTMTAEELKVFVDMRRLAREEIKVGTKKRTKSPLSRLSKELGISKREVARRLKEETGL